MSTRLCVIRHGETDWNVEKRIQGQTDIPLNATGRTQALAMAFNASHHHVHAIYSSDLQRAHHTALAIAERLGQSVSVLPALRERHYGVFQGITAHEGLQRYPQAHALYKARDVHYDFEQGESLLDFAQRVNEVVNKLARNHAGQNLVIVSHAGVLDVLYRRATNRPLHTARDFVIPNCALNWFRSNGPDWQLESWNDHHHLTAIQLESVE